MIPNLVKSVCLNLSSLIRSLYNQCYVLCKQPCPMGWKMPTEENCQSLRTKSRGSEENDCWRLNPPLLVGMFVPVHAVEKKVQELLRNLGSWISRDNTGLLVYRLMHNLDNFCPKIMWEIYNSNLQVSSPHSNIKPPFINPNKFFTQKVFSLEKNSMTQTFLIKIFLWPKYFY